MGPLALAIRKYADVHAGRIIFPEAAGELDFLMDKIVMPDETSDEPHHDDVRWGRHGDSGIGAVVSG
jgi:hypothetical protein